MKVLPIVTQTPDCGLSFGFAMQKAISSTLDTAQIEKTVVLNPLSNEIQINTDDFETFLNIEVTIVLKIVSAM